MLKKYKKKEFNKYWRTKDGQERLDRILHQNMHVFPEKIEEKFLSNLQQLLNENFIECRRDGNQIFLNPDEMEKLKDELEIMPEGFRKYLYKLGESTMMTWFEQQLRGVI